MIPIQRALISVSDKTGLVDFARGLAALGIELLASGGTARALQQAGCPVVEVADYTGSPEILDGRVKTLHPKIHAGILARREVPADLAQLAHAGWGTIDLVVVNLYPFRETVLREHGAWPISQSGVAAGSASKDPALPVRTSGGAGEEFPPSIIENIDIGGPTLLRAAAKNFAHVLTLCDPADYPQALAMLQSANGHCLPVFAQQCAAKVFALTAQYDAMVAEYFLPATGDQRPATSLRALPLQHALPLRYGENPQQAAQWYQRLTPPWIGALLQGKVLSYNNLLDADAALHLAGDLLDYPYAAAIIKHGTPCGVGVSTVSLCEAFGRALEADAMSAFGGIVVLTRPVDRATADAIAAHFFEVILAPGFADAARDSWTTKAALRVVPCTLPVPATQTIRSACGGVLCQQADQGRDDPAAWKSVTTRVASPAEQAAALLAWRVCKHVRSNAIVLGTETATAGIGAGQMSRVDAVRMAIQKSGQRTVLAAASDAFFPFPDGLLALADAGVGAVVQPGGAKRDADVIAAAEAHRMTMWMTGIRHFRH